MPQEDMQLLLKDLCARVPYHPKGHVVNACNGAEFDEWLTCAIFTDSGIVLDAAVNVAIDTINKIDSEIANL